MKYLLVGDYHIGISTDDNFLEYQKKSIKWAQNIASENDATLVHLGDYVHKRSVIDFKILDFIEENLIDHGYYEKGDYSNIFLNGNHDTYYKNNSNINFTNHLHKLYSSLDNIHTIIDQPYEKDNILFVPWINDANREVCLDAIKNTKCEYCVGHFDIVGFKMSNSYNSISGFDPIIFKKFKKVFSGHYHLNSCQENITYVGSVCQLSWTDLNESKYVYLLDTETGNIEKFVNPYEMYHEVHIMDNDPLGFRKDFRKNVYSHITNKYIKLYLHCDITIELQKIVDWFIDNNIDVDVITHDIQLHDNEMLEEVISNNIDESIDEGMKILLGDMDLKKSDRKKIFDLFKKIQMESAI